MACCRRAVLLGRSAGATTLRQASQLSVRLEVNERLASLPRSRGHDHRQPDRRACCLPQWLESDLAADRSGYHHDHPHLRCQSLVSPRTGQSGVYAAHFPPDFANSVFDASVSEDLKASTEYGTLGCPSESTGLVGGLLVLFLRVYGAWPSVAHIVFQPFI